MQARTFQRSALALAVAGAFATGVFVADQVGLRHAFAAPSVAVRLDESAAWSVFSSGGCDIGRY
jgi:hypothetical protein